MTLTEVKESLVEIFPETKHAVLMEDASGKITVVSHQRILQNKLDIALNNRVDEVIEEAVERAENRHPWPEITRDKIQVGTIQAAQITWSHAPKKTPPRYFPTDISRTEYEALKARAESFYVQTHSNGYTPGTRADKEPSEQEYRQWRLNEALKQFNRPQKEYPYVVGERYAERGNYAHLVGKSVKSILHDELIGVHVVKPEQEDKEYVIRESDLKLEE